MTREQILEQLLNSPKPTRDLAIEIYNSALDHAAQKALADLLVSDISVLQNMAGSLTLSVNKDSILNLKIK